MPQPCRRRCRLPLLKRVDGPANAVAVHWTTFVGGPSTAADQATPPIGASPLAELQVLSCSILAPHSRRAAERALSRTRPETPAGRTAEGQAKKRVSDEARSLHERATRSTLNVATPFTRAGVEVNSRKAAADTRRPMVRSISATATDVTARAKLAQADSTKSPKCCDYQCSCGCVVAPGCHRRLSALNFAVDRSERRERNKLAKQQVTAHIKSAKAQARAH